MSGVLLTHWLKARLYRFLGSRAFRSHRTETALANFQKAAKQEPENVHTMVEIARCLYQLADYPGAIEKCDEALSRKPAYAAAHAYRALALSEVDRVQEAVDELQRALRIGLHVEEKERGFWEGKLGAGLGNLGRYEEAIGPLRRSIELVPNDPDTRYELGRAYGELQRFQEAVEELQESIRLDPKWPTSHFALGVCYAGMGQFDSAVESYFQAIKLAPDDANTHYNLGVAYGDLGRVDEEISEYRKAIDIEPGDCAALINLAIAYSRSGRCESAIEIWKRLIALRPDSIEAHTSLSMDYERLGRFQDALDVAQEIERISPNAIASGNVAVFLNRLGHFDAALLKAREAMCFDPTHPDPHLSAGFALQGLSDHKAAICEYQKAIELKPDLLLALVNLGNAHLELGRSQEAVAPLKRAIELNPDCVDAHDNLGLAHLKNGDREAAMEELHTIERLDPTFDSALRQQLAEGGQSD